jgi:hypothetical protein
LKRAIRDAGVAISRQLSAEPPLRSNGETAIRWAIPAAALAALVVGIAVPAPQHVPSPALDSRELLWLERTLVLFYGFLLLFVPFLRALAGELPVELSTRGARYADSSEQAIHEHERRLTGVEALPRADRRVRRPAGREAVTAMATLTS